MKKIPDVLVAEMRREMDGRKVGRPEQVEWFKWLRYYLDFCLKYHHSTRDPETEVLYLQKLSSKGQSDARQRQASACIRVFRDVAKRFPAKGKEQVHSEELSEWGEVLVRLDEVVRLRQYAKTTRKTYRNWILQFQDFLESKPVGEVNDDDAVRFLTCLATERKVVSTTQNQAFNALLFLFRHVLKRPYDLGDKVKRARRTRYVPVVLDREEVDEVLSRMEDPTEYHVHDSQFSKSFRHAVCKSGINKKVGAHTLRHTFASHLLLANVDIRTIQEMMGHADVKTTMIYTQTVPSRTQKERKSPLDMEASMLKWA